MIKIIELLERLGDSPPFSSALGADLWFPFSGVSSNGGDR